MKLFIAVKGLDVSKDIGSCDSFLLYEQGDDGITAGQIVGNSSYSPDSLSDLLEDYKIDAFLCGEPEQQYRNLFAEHEISVVSGLRGNADKAAREFIISYKQEASMKSCLQPMPKVLVSCRGLNGEDNALAVAFCCNCSFAPPMVMVGIVPAHYSYSMIRESGCFVVNLAGKGYAESFNYLGSHSRRDGDKLANIGARLQDGKKVNAPILLDCPVNIECSVVDSILTGSHEMFIGKVEYVHADPGLLDGEGNIDFSGINFL